MEREWAERKRGGDGDGEGEDGEEGKAEGREKDGDREEEKGLLIKLEGYGTLGRKAFARSRRGGEVGRVARSDPPVRS